MKCGDNHQHLICPMQIPDVFPDCKHQIQKKCGDQFSNYKCKATVLDNLECGHEVEKICSEDKGSIECKSPCNALNNCLLHKCKQKCGSNHSHETCDALVKATFELCPHETEKKCSEPITWPCNRTVPVKLNCGHESRKLCCEPISEAVCHHPCGKTRPCGHVCLSKYY